MSLERCTRLAYDGSESHTVGFFDIKNICIALCTKHFSQTLLPCI